MSLQGPSVLKQKILDLAPTEDKVEGMTNLVAAIGSYMNKMQGGSTGQPGIFKLTEPAMVAILTAMPPVSDDSWTAKFAAAYAVGCLTAIITPGTVSNPAWAGSGGKDVVTLPLGAVSIPTIAAAAAVLATKLKDTKDDPEPPQKFAEAIDTATKLFTFLCIGLGPPPVFPPIPIPTPVK